MSEHTIRSEDHVVTRTARGSAPCSALKLLCSVIPLLLAAACVTTPKYEAAIPECLEYAIASCRAAIVEDGMDAGLIHYIPSWGDGTAHVVVWIRDENGRERIYDPSYRLYRTLTKDDIILHRGDGLDLGF